MRIRDLSLIGIGTGSRQHLTREAEETIRQMSVMLIPRKRASTADLFDLRNELLKDVGYSGVIQPFDYPKRNPKYPYLEGVRRWHEEIASRWQRALSELSMEGRVGLLIWGDPTLYDSTMRIARHIKPPPRVQVFSGITAIQALTSAHAIPLNSLAGSIKVTTGRRLQRDGWPANIESVVVMLDGEVSFTTLTEPDLEIWWGAYLATPNQILIHGRLPEIGERIVQRRAEARDQVGWIMDTYLMRKAKYGRGSDTEFQRNRED